MRGEASIVDLTLVHIQGAGSIGAFYQGPHLSGLEQSVDASQSNIGHLAASLRQAAEEYDRRAIICDEYTENMRVWKIRLDTWEIDNTAYWNAVYDPTSAVDHPGSRPDEPMRWPAWVEEDVR